MLIDPKQAERVFEDTYEDRIRALVCTCNEKGWSLVSTKADSAHVIESDGRLAKRSYTFTESGIDWGRAYYLETFPSSDAVGLVSKTIRDLAKNILESDDPKINRESLGQLSQHAKDYMSVPSAMSVLSGGEMVEFYEENKESVRKSCRGNLGDIEASIKITYYTNMSQKRMVEHLDEIKATLTTCAKALDTLECHGDGNIFSHIANFKENAIKASAIIKHSGCSPENMAKSADYFSRSLLTANILKDYAVRTNEGN